METFVIGDIEDSPQAFRDACECISNHPNVRIIFLGDIYHPHTSSETIANTETILNLLGIRIRQFFLEGVTLEPSEHRRHSERISQAFLDLYLQKELEKYTPTDKIRFQIFTSDKSNEEYWRKGQRKCFKDNFNHGYSQPYSESENNTISTCTSNNHGLNNANIETVQDPDEVYNATRTLRLNCEYKLWREVQEDDEGPIFLFGNKEIDLIRDLAELNMSAVDSQGTIYYDIEYFRNKRRKSISQSLTIHEVNVLLTYLSLCEDAVVIGKTLFTHIYVNARQIYYHSHQFNTTYDTDEIHMLNEFPAYEHKRLSSNGAQTIRSFSEIRQKHLPSYYKVSSVDETHSSVNYYMNKHYTNENKRFIHVVVGHSKCFGSFFDPEHPEIQITMLDITGDTSFDPEHPHGRTGPVEIGFKNYIKFTPCSSNENKSLVAHIIFNSSDTIIQEMLKFKLPAKQLFLTSKLSPLISVIDFYRARREYYLQKLETRNIRRNDGKSNSNSEDSETFQKHLHTARSLQPAQSAHELGSWRNSTHQRTLTEVITKEREPIIQRRPSICLAEMDIKMDKSSDENTELKSIEEIKEEPVFKQTSDDNSCGNSSPSALHIDSYDHLRSIEENMDMNNSEQPYVYKHHFMESWMKEEKSLEPIKSVKFNESSNTESLQYINTNPPAHGQIRMFNQPLTFNIVEEYKSEAISNDISSHNELLPSATSQEDDIKLHILSDEELPSSLKLKNI